MPRSGGVYVAPASSWNPPINGNLATPGDWQALLADLSNGITQSISADGTTPITANLNMASFKLTGLGPGTAAGDSLRWEQLFSQGVPTTVASAATTDIGAVNSTFLEVSGTTNITSLGTNYNGPRYMRFGGILNIAYNATTLILPGGQSIVTAVGDVACFIPKATAGTTDGWVMLDYRRVANGLGTVPRGYIGGLTMSTAGASATLTVAAGQASDSANVVTLNLASAISKTTSNWAVGTAAGGLDTGAIAINSWYHWYLIRRPDTGVVDVIYSLSASAPALPANYTQYRRIGSARINASSQWTQFVQVGDEFLWTTSVADQVSITFPTASRTLYTLTVPTGVQVNALFRVNVTNAGSGYNAAFTSPDESDQAPSANFSDLSGVAAATGPSINKSVRTNTSAQIGGRCNAGSTAFWIGTYGWIDTRGRFA